MMAYDHRCPGGTTFSASEDGYAISILPSHFETECDYGMDVDYWRIRFRSDLSDLVQVITDTPFIRKGRLTL